MSVPEIHVIILNYNGKKYLRPCVASVLDQRGVNVRVLVVDNASTDGSLAELPKDQRLEILQNNDNLYFAKGNNRGVHHVLQHAPQYVFILNNDTQLAPDCLQRLAAFMDETPEAAGCQPALLFMAAPERVNSLGCRCSLSGKSWDAGMGEPYDPERPPHDVLGITGGAMLLRPEYLRRTGGFCPWFTMYSEDVDLSLQIRAMGATLWCVPQATVLHAFGGTALGSMPLRRLFYCERNSFYVVLRNYPLAKVAKSYLFCTPFRLLVAGNAIRQGRWRYALAVLAGTAVGLAALPWLLVRRLLAQEKKDYSFWRQMDEGRLVPPRPPEDVV